MGQSKSMLMTVNGITESDSSGHLLDIQRMLNNFLNKNIELLHYTVKKLHRTIDGAIHIYLDYLLLKMNKIY
ncbi:Protein of unknown function [Cotesia congregata]|uniref:Uncharacterized protein n=1 Tax=Cotesia congregata TaxID=51543 RepID=A0A8J2HJX4_COTCN|nr:Protein of unknown function [Cotesia congregata]